MTDTAPTGAEDGPLDIWAIVELFGHIRRAGRVREQDVAGAGFIRLDIPDGDGWITQLLNPKAIYALTPTSEATARTAAGKWRPEPVRPWELEAPTYNHDDQPEF